MRKTFAILILLFSAATAAAQKPQGEQPKKPIRMGIGRTVTFPFRHPVATQKGIAKGVKKAAQAIW